METTQVKLVSELGEKYFDVDHAERILRMPINGGWKLADERFVFDLENGITTKRNKAKDTREKETANDK